MALLLSNCAEFAVLHTGRSSTSATVVFVGETVGVREIRQRASELIRRAEAGEEILVTVSGRVAARLAPIHAPDKSWRNLAELAQVWAAPTDTAWDAERRADSRLDHAAIDPWERVQE